jgi:CelD/BcsL family acetyltransferase involved in cellulose biosynthesis
MTAPALVGTEPPCPGTDDEGSETPSTTRRRLILEQIPFDEIDRATWDRLAAGNPWATPFSTWAFHRAWWDAYATNAHEETLVVRDAVAGAGGPVAIVPLMHRHEVEPTDADRRTTIRHVPGSRLIEVPPTAKAIFFGASYHADYATILASPGDLPSVAGVVADHLAEPSADPSHPRPWDVVDLRRLRCGDPTAEELARAFRIREAAHGWNVDLEREDVCPVATLPDGGTLDDYLSTLGKHTRHEFRRKLRRAHAAGEVRLTDSTDPLRDLDRFIDLHQRRWGDDGLFRPTEGGRQSRVFLRRLFELFGAEGPLKLAFLTVGERTIASGISVETGERLFYYNAGIDPDARELSPGVVMAAMYVQRAIELRIPQLDFLRGSEPYKYDWGAEDEPIQRLLVRRIDEA